MPPYADGRANKPSYGHLHLTKVTDRAKEAVVMHCNSWWPDGFRAKSVRKDRGVEFVEVNIQNDREAEAFVLRVNNGRRKIPTLQIGDRYFACSLFNAQQLAMESKVPLNR